jgi:signal transduction histidine kinase
LSRTFLTRGWSYPITVWLFLLVIVFVAEYVVMQMLPSLVAAHSSRVVEAAVDSVIPTLMVAPILWWTIVRPLREAIRLRTQFLTDLFAQIESDRRRTARELHDGVGQSLTLLISGTAC